MVDLETLGTEPGCVIVSISAVQFDMETGETGKLYNRFISVEDSVERGLVIEPSTTVWWLSQSTEAITKLSEGIKAGKNTKLSSALTDFNSWMLFTLGRDFEIWGNSNRFEFGILEAAYKAVNIKPYWNHRNERDVRTLVSLAPEIKEGTVFEGVKHDGIDDCKHQIKYCSTIYKAIMEPIYGEEETAG